MLFHCRTQYSALFSTSLSIHINVASIWKIRYFHRRNFWEFRAPILKLEHSHRFDLLKVISVHFSQSSSPGYFAYIPPVLNKFTAILDGAAALNRSARFVLLCWPVVDQIDQLSFSCVLSYLIVIHCGLLLCYGGCQAHGAFDMQSNQYCHM